MYSLRFYVDAGGLIPYSTDLIKSYRRAAAHVDKILRGARPGDLPVEQPTKFEDSGNLRDAILKMNHNTVFGAFRVDRNGAQIGHKLVLFQWQDGKKAIVWPEELAPGPPRFPTPPWNRRP